MNITKLSNIQFFIPGTVPYLPGKGKKYRYTHHSEFVLYSYLLHLTTCLL